MKLFLSISLIVLISVFAFTNKKTENKSHTLETKAVKSLAEDGELTNEIKISGEVEQPLTITVEELKKMNVFEGGTHQLVCRSGENRKKINTFKGVLLKDVIEKAKIKISNPKESGAYVVLITSTNNYKVSFAYNELFFNETGNNVYVTFEENGAPITNDGGLMSIISLDDKITGVRHVKWPAKIEIMKLN